MRLPDVQAAIADISKRLRLLAVELDTLEQEISRRSPNAKGPVTSRSMTPALRAEVRRLSKRGMSQLAIAKALDINQGRVSETIRGKRT